MAQRDQPPAHPVQLASILATSLHCQNRRRRETDLGEPQAFLGDPRLVSFASDGMALECEFRTILIVPVRDEAVWEARVVLRGQFVCTQALKRSQAVFFANTSALWVMLPFARAQVMQLASLAGVDAPPLPLVIRPPHVGGPASRS
jgi:hypothetical protein